MKLKRLLALVLAIVMSVGMAATAIADVNGTLTITTVYFKIDEAIVGSAPDLTPEFGSENVGCEFITFGGDYGVCWYNLTESRDMAEGDVFEADKEYVAYFYFGAIDGYCFGNYNGMSAYVNGALLDPDDAPFGGLYGMDDTKYLHVCYKVTPVSTHSITVTNGYATDSEGNKITEAKAGDVVTITAEDTTGIRSFNWWSYYGEKVEFADDEAETTTFVMPDYSVVIDAFFSDVLVEEAKFTLAGYYIGESVESLEVLASEGIKILPIDGYPTNCVLFPDKNGRPDEIAVTGAIQANKYHWVGIRIAAEEGYDICELMPENVVLNGALDSIFSSNGDYDNLEATVFFKLPYASKKPVISENVVIDTVEVNGVTAPIPGVTADRDIYIPEDANYSIYESVWKRLEDSDSASGFSILGRDDTFELNRKYQIDIVLVANQGYEFKVNAQGEPNVIAKLNGETAMQNIVDGKDSAKEYIQISYVFTCGAPVILDNAVTITIETIAPSFTDMGDITVVFVSVEDPSVSYSFKTTLKTTLDDGKTTLDDGKTTLDDGKTTLDDGKTTLDDGKTTLDDGKTTLDDGKTTLDDGKTTLDEGKTTLGEGKTTLDFYLKTTDGFLKTTDIPEGEYIIKTTKPGFVAQDFKTTLKTTGPANLKTTLHVYGDTDGSGEIDSMDYVLLKRAYFGTYKLKLEFVGDTNGSGEIDSMDYVLLKRAYFGTFKTTSFGKTTLDDGKTTLDDGKTTLDDGKTTLDTGKTTLDTGKTTLDTGKTTLDTGKTTLDVGKTTL